MCEDNTAICGMKIERQKPFEWSKFEEIRPKQFAWHVAINGIKFKCCPTGKSISFLGNHFISNFSLKNDMFIVILKTYHDLMSHF